MLKVNSTCIADMSGMDEFIKQALRLSNKEAAVGFDSAIHEDSGLAYAGLAKILNDGADDVNIPPRLFMESTNDLFEYDNNKQINLTVRRILYKGFPTEEELLKLANKEKTIMQQVMKLKLFDYPNNKPSTIAIKGRDDALIDTKELFNNIRTEVGKFSEGN